jgi:arylsulfatase A-like enzyme
MRHLAPSIIAALGCALLLAPGGGPGAGGAVASARPSLILIVTDDQRSDTLSFMPIAQRELVARGTTFTNAFVTTPLCCPSRASILRGQYAHNTGVLTNGPARGRRSRYPGGAESFPTQSTLATWLRAAGYRTGLFGKYLNGYMTRTREVPPGWDEWQVFGGAYFDYALNENGALRRYGQAPEDYSTDVIARQVVRFIEEAGAGPLFVYFAPFAPHAPATPHPRDASAFRDLPPWRPPSYDEEDVGDKPAWVRRLPPLTPQGEAGGDEFRRNQLRALQAVDRAIGLIVEALRRTGRLESSLLVYTSDNGLSWGEHRYLARKGCPYEECLRVPFVVRGPGVPAGGADDRFVLNIDIAPTFVDLAAAVADLPADGRSLVPLWRAGDVPWRPAFLAEHWGPPILTWAAIRTDRWIYVEYENGDRELYDLRADAAQLANLAALPALAATVAQLRARLEALRRDGH